MTDKKVIAKLRRNKATKQKVLNVPKQTETEHWEEEDLIEMKKVELK